MLGPEQRRHRPELFPEGEACAIQRPWSRRLDIRRLIILGNNDDRQVACSTGGCSRSKNLRPACPVVCFPPEWQSLVLAEEVACFF